MPGLSLVSSQPAAIVRGEILGIQVTDAGHGLEPLFFLRHPHVLNPSPLTSWEPPTKTLSFAEAPGDFQIALERRMPDESHGRLEQSISLPLNAEAPTGKSVDSPSTAPHSSRSAAALRFGPRQAGSEGSSVTGRATR